MSDTRHIDTGASLIGFADEVLVRCTRCGAPGCVRSERPGWSDAVYACGACGLSLASSRRDWAGPLRVCGRRPCGHCGHRWVTVDRAVQGDAPRQLGATCAVCGHVSMVDLHVHRSVPHDRAIDPHLGLPLLLLTQARCGTVWVYNRRHLDELKAYVGAKLRRRRDAGHWSMFSRLPAWMKSARHRDAVLKSLDRIQAMLPPGQATGSMRS